MRQIERSDLGVDWWSPAGWGLILVEGLFLFYLWSVRTGEDEVSHYLRLREGFLGLEGRHASPILPMLVINLLAVVALWIAHRRARGSRTRQGRIVRATALAAAVVFAALTWNAYRFVRTLPPLEVHEVLRRAPSGDYEILRPEHGQAGTIPNLPMSSLRGNPSFPTPGAG